MPPLASSTDTIMGVLLMVVLVLGYVALWALWHFVFRNAPADGSKPPDEPLPPPPG